MNDIIIILFEFEFKRDQMAIIGEPRVKASLCQWMQITGWDDHFVDDDDHDDHEDDDDDDDDDNDDDNEEYKSWWQPWKHPKNCK